MRLVGPARRLWRACRYPLLVVALSRLVVVMLFAMEGWVTRPHGAGVGLPQMLRDLGAWDGIWYRSIAVHGYDPSIGHGDNAAFLPFYPFLLHGLRVVAPFVDLVWLGAALSTALMAVGMCLLYKLTTSASAARSHAAPCCSCRSRRSPSCSRRSMRRASSWCS